MKIHIKRGQEDFGPFSQEEFQSHYSNGSIQPNDLAWHSGHSEWINAAELFSQLNTNNLPPILKISHTQQPKKNNNKKIAIFGSIGCITLLIVIIGLIAISSLVEDEIGESTKTPKYTIVESAKLNYSIYQRRSYRIRVNKMHSEEELELIANNILKLGRENEPNSIDSAVFYFYLPETETNGPHTAGLVTWAPDGKWGNEDSTLPHKFITETGGAFDGQLSDNTVDRFSLDERRKIFEELIKSERLARKEASTLHPNDIEKEQERFGKLSDLYKAKIVSDNRLSNDELNAIINEGIRKNWTPPIE